MLHGPRIRSPTTALPTALDSSISKKVNSYSTLVQPRVRAKTPQTSPDGSESTNFLYEDIAIKETGLDTYNTIDSRHKGNGLDTYEKIDLSPRRQAPVGTSNTSRDIDTQTTGTWKAKNVLLIRTVLSAEG